MEDKNRQVGSNCCMKSLQHKGRSGANCILSGLVKSVTTAKIPDAWLEILYGPGQLDISVQSSQKPK